MAKQNYESVRIYETDRGMIITNNKNRIFGYDGFGELRLGETVSSKISELTSEEVERLGRITSQIINPGFNAEIFASNDMNQGHGPSYTFEIKKVTILSQEQFKQLYEGYEKLEETYMKKVKKVDQDIDSKIKELERKKTKLLTQLQKPSLVDLVRESLRK